MYKITFSILWIIGILFFGCGKDTPAPTPKVMPDRVAMDVGDSTMAIRSVNTLKAWVLPENADDKTVLWSSSDPTVVSVDANGRIEALKEGNAYITATAKLGGISTSRQVTVQRDEHRLMGWLEYFTVPNYSLTAMELTLTNASNTPFTVKNIEIFHQQEQINTRSDHTVNKVVSPQSSESVFTYDSYSSYVYEYHVKVYIVMNKRNFVITVRNGSWRVDHVNDFSIGIEPGWGEDSDIELP